jgi:hypothetical protein
MLCRCPSRLIVDVARTAYRLLVRRVVVADEIGGRRWRRGEISAAAIDDLFVCAAGAERERKERDSRKGRSLTGTHHAGFFRTPKHVDAPDPMSTPKSLVDPNPNSSNRLSSVP